MRKKFTVDLSPLRTNRNFRYLWSAGFVSTLGSMITYVALPFQIKIITDSYIAVGAMGAIEIIPLVVFGLYGGVLADKIDRKKLILATEFAALFISLGLYLNSRLEHPHLIALYVAAGLFSAVDGLQRPSQNAILPRIVAHADQPSATALMSLRWQFGAVTGPAIAGVLIATAGISVGYLVDVVSYLLSILLLWRLASVPPTHENDTPNFASLVEGVKYATSRKDLLGTYLVDLAAMFFAMPNALFPFWAEHLHANWSLGLFYAAGTIGSIAVTLTSGWIRTYRFHGRAVMWAALGWGVAISLAGATTSLPLTILFLGIAGASDMVSALARSAIWNQSIPDEYRGRLAGIELLSYSVGPLGGQLRAGTMAAVTSLRTSVVSGGLLCIGFVAFAAKFLPEFRKYDVETNEFAVRERKIRESDGLNQ